MHLVNRLFFTALTTVASLQQLTPRCDRRSALLGVGTAALAAAPGSRALAATGSIPTWRLAGGVAFPTLALNTAGMSVDGAELAFRNAIAAGISHVEFHPGIERDGVARVLPSIARKSVFLSTKIETDWERAPSPSAAAESVRKRLDADLAALGVGYVDMLMLRESPDCAVMQAMWVEMETAKAEGRARSLGVVSHCNPNPDPNPNHPNSTPTPNPNPNQVNYCEGALKCLLSTAKERPSVNYLQLHAGMGPDSGGLRAFGESRGIRTFAYGHLGERAMPKDDREELLASPTLQRIGAAHGGRAAEDVALRWVLQSGAAASVRPTSDFELGGRSACDATSSACADGLRASARAFSWQLTAAEMKEIDAITSPKGYPTLFSSPGCPDSFFAT
jgi:diketogulonate reductase-like aldo/keto reductase